MPSIPWEQVRDVVDTVLDLPAEARASYLDQACAEPALRRYVESLIRSYTQAGDFLDEPAAVHHVRTLTQQGADSWRGRRIGSYQIIEQIGEGGMGEVYRAVRADDQYQKQVAIKLVRGGFDSRFTVARFKAERQILANLDHPNITRLPDGGATEEGQPYLVMEYVQGLSLDEYCDRHKLKVAERLHLFCTACSAVQFAHQNLVIRRDIKPGNILVTEDGTPKLLDFGIAKILGPDAADSTAVRTLTMVRLLTPEYASPEQLRGEPISTASDVYSLGVVLYELLTGHRPYRPSSRNPDEIARALAETQPEKPSTAIRRVEETTDGGGNAVKVTPETVSKRREGSVEKLRRRLSGDLDNIVLMALRKEPQRRYASVEQFSADIRRHLEGLPVAATAVTFSYRSSKFIRRNATAVAAAELVALSLVAGLAVALREAHIARAQRTRAERRFNDVRKLANSLIFDIHDSIQDLPGSTPARKLLVSGGLQYLDSLAKEAAGDVSLQQELAKAYLRVGDVQGYPYGPNLGDTRGSMESYHKALAVTEALLKVRPSDSGLRSDLLTCYQRIGNVLSTSGDVAGALQNQRKAVAISEELSTADPSNTGVRRKLFVAYMNLGDVLVQEGDQPGALGIYRKALVLAQPSYRSDPKNPQAGVDLSLCYAKIGDVLVRTGNRPEALKYYRDSLCIRQALSAADPTNADYRSRLSAAYERLGDLLVQEGNVKAALENQRKALVIDESLAAADPANVDDQLSLALSHSNVGELLERSGKLKSAQANYHQSIVIMEGLAARNPANTEVRFYLADSYAELGSVAAKIGNPADAGENYIKAATMLQPLLARDPANSEVRNKLADYYFKLGDLNKSQALAAKSSAAFQTAQWNAARSWFYKSLGTQVGTGSPAPSDPDQIGNVRREIAFCDRALAGFKAQSTR